MSYSDSDTIQFLESHHIFHGVSSGDLAIIFPFLEYGRFEAGDRMIEEGQQGTAIFIITTGSVAVTKKNLDGDSVLLGELRAGDTFGEMGLLEHDIASASVTAKEKTAALELSHQAFHDIFECRPSAFRAIMLNIARDLSRRLREADAKIAALS